MLISEDLRKRVADALAPVVGAEKDIELPETFLEEAVTAVLMALPRDLGQPDAPPQVSSAASSRNALQSAAKALAPFAAIADFVQVPDAHVVMAKGFGNRAAWLNAGHFREASRALVALRSAL